MAITLCNSIVRSPFDWSRGSTVAHRTTVRISDAGTCGIADSRTFGPYPRSVRRAASRHLTSTSRNATPLPARLLAWWPLDDPTSDGARQFDGTQFLACGGLGRHEAVSIALCAKADSFNHTWNPLLFGNDVKCGVVHFSLLADGRPNVAVNTGEQNWTHRTARTGVVVSQWHHFILVCDARIGGSARFYIDGQRVNEERMSLGIQLDMDTFRIGAWNQWEGTPANNFHGAVRDVRIYSGMLTDEQAVQLAADKPAHQ